MRWLVIILVAFPMLGLHAKIPTTGKFSIEYRKAKRKVWDRVADEYRRYSKDDDPKVKSLVLRLIADHADHICRLKGFKAYPEIGEEGRKLAAMDPVDPLAKTLSGMAIMFGGNDRVSDFVLAEGLIRDGADGLNNSRYSLFVKMSAARWMKRTVVRSKKVSGRVEKKAWEDFVNKTLDWILASPTDVEEKMAVEVMSEIFHETTEPALQSMFFEKMMSSRKASPWLKNMAAGKFHLFWIWHYSTQNKGKKTPIKQLSSRERLAAAAKALKAAHRMHPDRPEAATELIAVSMRGGAAESTRHWFDLAVNAEVDYFPAYEKLLWALRPDWGGSHEAMLKFAKECVATGRYDTVIPNAYVRAFEDILNDLGGDYTALRRLKLYSGLDKVLRGYEREEDQGNYCFGNKNYVKAIHFGYAIKSNRFDHAVELHQRYKRDIYSAKIFRKLQLSYAPTVGLAYAMTGPAAKTVVALDVRLNWESSFKRIEHKWRAAAEVDDLISKLREARQLTKAKEAAPYFDKLDALLAMEKKFNDGKWVKLKFTKNLATWHIYGGHFQVEDERTLLASNTNNQFQYIASNAYFRPPYTVELEVESIRSNWRGNHLQAGFICGRMFGPQTGRTFWVDGLRGRCGIGIPTESPSGLFLQKKKRKNKMTVNIWPGYYECFVNENDAMDEDDPKFAPLRIGLGIMPWYPISGVVRYSNVRIRKLDFDRPPRSGKGKERELAAYYEERLKRRKSDFLYEKLGFAYWTIGENKKSIEGYRKAYGCFVEAAKLDRFHYSYPLFLCWLGGYLRKYHEIHPLYEEVLRRSKSRKKDFRERSEALFLNSYAWHLATCPVAKYRDPKKAVAYARRAVKENKDRKRISSCLDTLGCSLAASGDFKGALAAARGAFAKATDANYKKNIQKRIELFKQKKPYLEPVEERTTTDED